ncbi:MAG: thioredoxin [Clostridia bacterium]|nr:thioredoxin [Clostridia bacterium]
MKQRGLFFALLVLSAALIAVGCAQGQPAAVLSKAITVCLECIGIG